MPENLEFVEQILTLGKEKLVLKEITQLLRARRHSSIKTPCHKLTNLMPLDLLLVTVTTFSPRIVLFMSMNNYRLSVGVKGSDFAFYPEKSTTYPVITKDEIPGDKICHNY